MNKRGISATQVALPKGGGAIQGIGETFQSNEFTGTASLAIPIPTSPCRGFEPQLSVEYSSGGGNGIFGLGFGLSIPNVARKTSKRVPKYDESDTFLLSNAEDLVPVQGSTTTQTLHGSSYTVVSYRPRIEGLFARIEQWSNSNTGDSHWRVVSQENITSIFGRTEDTRIVDPGNPSHIFQWLLAEIFDAKGNHIVYDYESENSDNISPAIYEINRIQPAHKYIKRIKYGNVQPFEEGQDTSENWLFEVVFDYGEYNIDPKNPKPFNRVQQWAARLDPFSSYHAGFEIRTHRLCRHVLMFHRFSKELGTEPVLVHATRFYYTESPTVSLLSAVESIGYRFENGKYLTKSLPPLAFNYTSFDPRSYTFEPLVEENGQPLPGLNLSPDYQLIDLYGEGIPGILYSDGRATLYWEPEGDGDTVAVRYAAPQAPLKLPIASHREGMNSRLMDLTGNGQLELVVSTPASTGYYEANPDHSWKNFQTFPAFPTDFHNPNNYLVDVTGDGLADLVLIENERVWVYPSLGKDGFGQPLMQQRQNGLPLSRHGAANEVVQFADLFGTGTQHLVRITNGKVECWPNLGYGRFGKPVQLGNAPRFGTDLDASRLFLADLDGSGTPDLIYVYPDRIEVFLNLSGNSFSKPLTVPLPSRWDRLNQIEFADVHGNGTTCLIFSENHPQPRHWCCDFNQAQKPYLLNKIDNHLGARSHITYSSSTKFYLADKKQGHPWIVNLPFPVQVVEKTESYDLISETRLVSTYSYHHGFYDGEEREFRGFGRVERQDAEILTVDHHPLDVPPILTKTWYHTGACQQEESLSRQYEQEYFQGDTQAHLLPDSVFDAPEGQPDADTRREALRALKGSVLREEVYALDGSDLQANPYTVTETSYRVRSLQPKGQNPYGVYFVHSEETLAYHYERNPADPRIQHDFVLEVTEFGNVTQACSVYYGRRSPQDSQPSIYSEQAALKATVQVAEFIEETNAFRLIGIPYEEKTFEINGLVLQEKNLYFSLDQIRQQVNEALKQSIPYGGEFTSGVQARLLSWQQSYFWNLTQNGTLPLGQVTERSLLHHQQHAIFSQEWVKQIYGDQPLYQDQFGQEILHHQGGYFQGEGQEAGYWWNKGLVQHYFSTDSTDPQAIGPFYLPWKTANDFAAQAQQIDGLRTKTIASYDDYFLVPIHTEAYITDSLKQVIEAELDYRTLTPWQLTDMNQVIHQARFDPLGMVIATSIFKPAKDGVARQGDGDLSGYPMPSQDVTFKEVLADPEQFLKTATSFFYYNLSAWQEQQQPASYISLTRQTHVSELGAGEKTVIQVAVGYSDGFGRAIEQKQWVEPGEAILRDEVGNLRRDGQGASVQGAVAQRWLVSGRTVFNNKGKPAEQYLPYFSNTALYETQAEIVAEKLVPSPTVIHYDPLLREIRIDTPKGLFSKVEFTPWEVRHYDENDTVKDAAYYQQFIAHYPEQPTEEQKKERSALEKAVVFYNTPSVTVLDSLGNAFLEIQNNLGAVREEAFQEIVGTATSKAVWEALIAQNYLVKSESDAHEAWVTESFQPYSREFKAKLGAALAEESESYRPFAEAILNRLRQNGLTSYHRHDIQGREMESIDPRLYFANVTQGTSYANFKYAYAMGDDGKTPLTTDSADAGRNLSLHNIFGGLLWNLSPRNFDQVIEYDRLQRKSKIRVKGIKNDGTIATDHLVETFTYGEGQPQAEECNLGGQLYQHQDQSGIITNHRYGLQGELLETTRQLTQEYKEAINWDANPDLEKDQNRQDITYKTQFRFNALQQLIAEITPDGSITTNGYNQGGLLDRVTVQFPDGKEQPIIDRIDYNANRQRTRVAYANGVTTTYTYEDTTLHLIGLNSRRFPKDSQGRDQRPVLQDITYTYDPVGNITHLIDRSHETVFYNNQKVEPLSEYTYDALYRLIQANGRQHPGINGATYRNNEQAGDFKQSKSYIPVNDASKLETYTETYSYDEAGNLIQTIHDASNRWIRAQEIRPDSNRLKSVSTRNGFTESLEITYDRSGNQQQLNGNSTIKLTFNCCENLVTAVIIERTGQTNDADYYTYDSNELRIRKVSERWINGGVVTEKEEKIYCGNYEIKRIKTINAIGETIILKRQTLRVMDDKTCVAIIHDWEQDERQREVANPGTRSLRFQLDNHLGSVALEVDEDAQVISYEEYFPYGGTALIAGRNQREVKLKEYRYSGKERDDSTGLYYYGARYYAPWLGRWISSDPAETMDGIDLYIFVGGNPLVFKDMEGLSRGEYFIIQGKAIIGKPKARPSNQNNPAVQQKIAERLPQVYKKRKAPLPKHQKQFIEEVEQAGRASLKDSLLDICHVTSCDTMKETLATSATEARKAPPAKRRRIDKAGQEAIKELISSDEESDREEYAEEFSRAINPKTKTKEAVSRLSKILLRLNKGSRNLRPDHQGPNRGIGSKKDPFLIKKGRQYIAEERAERISKKFNKLRTLVQLFQDRPHMKGTLVKSSSVAPLPTKAWAQAKS